MRLIDADKLVKKSRCKRDCSECDFARDGDSWCKGELFVVDILRAPTVDAVEVMHGHWIEMERGHYFKCSRCRNPIPYKFGWKVYNGVVFNKRYYNYCPNCGAKMDGGDGNE